MVRGPAPDILHQRERREGQEAWRVGDRHSKNPYPGGSTEAEWWDDGWREAEDFHCEVENERTTA